MFAHISRIRLNLYGMKIMKVKWHNLSLITIEEDCKITSLDILDVLFSYYKQIVVFINFTLLNNFNRSEVANIYSAVS